MPKVYAPEDRSDEAYERAVQELLDADMEGREAGLNGCSFETNPYIPTDPCWQRWADAWREGIWRRATRMAA